VRVGSTRVNETRTPRCCQEQIMNKNATTFPSHEMLTALQNGGLVSGKALEAVRFASRKFPGKPDVELPKNINSVIREHRHQGRSAGTLL